MSCSPKYSNNKSCYTLQDLKDIEILQDFLTK